AAEADRLRGLLDEIAETERQINAMQAQQVLQVAAFVEGREVLETRSYGAVSEVGAADYGG
ncbi:MAG: hypothetical protein ABJA81_06405, partial [Nocardioidaceae bacterium]